MANLDSRTADVGMRAQAHPGLNALDWIALILLVIGGLNWGLVGLANFDLVAFLFGPMSGLSRVIYLLVGLSALYTLYLSTRIGKKV